MIQINSRSKLELLNEIHQLNGNGVSEEVYISLRPTVEITEELLKQCPSLKKILCPPSLYLQVSKRVFKRLSENNIELKAGEFSVGRPRKYKGDTIKQILNERSTGKSAKKISEEYDIPLRTVYYHIKNGQE